MMILISAGSPAQIQPSLIPLTVVLVLLVVRHVLMLLVLVVVYVSLVTISSMEMSVWISVQVDSMLIPSHKHVNHVMLHA
jgi:hypothetical protein